MYLLAFRSGPPSTALHQRLFAWLTGWWLRTDFPHGGIVVDGVLWHSTLSGGVHPEPFKGMYGTWVALPITGVPEDLLILRIAERNNAKYDVASLLRFFGLPVRDRQRDYCFEFMWYVLTGEAASVAVTPERLLIKLAEVNNV